MNTFYLKERLNKKYIFPIEEKINYFPLDFITLYKNIKSHFNNTIFFSIRQQNQITTIVAVEPKIITLGNRITQHSLIQINKLFNNLKNKWNNKISIELIDGKTTNSSYKELLEKKGNYQTTFTGGLFFYAGFNTFNNYLTEQNKTINPKKVPTYALLFVDSAYEIALSKKKISIIHAIFSSKESLSHEINQTKKKTDILKKILYQSQKTDKSKNSIYQDNYIRNNININSVLNEDIKNSLRKKIIDAKNSITQKYLKQVNISLNVKFKYTKELSNVYQFLLEKYCASYVFLYDINNMTFTGSSPEMLVKKEGKTCTIEPLSGSFPVSTNQELDKTYESQLLTSTKEKQEHNEIINEVKKDLKKVCKINTVIIHDKREILKLPYVQHLSTRISGEIKQDYSCFDLIRNCFPPIAITGVPRNQAINIIEEIEENKRITYGGGLGLIDFKGNCNIGVLIRTYHKHNKNQISLQVGSKISSGSNVEDEKEEIITKTKNLLKLLNEVKM
ncbi:hypothetical protein GF327_00395 [Candidatus Woesearchaeota archaeon]|nr:hypothetical protein [Candidatus Woesearchaeota archaeon]